MISALLYSPKKGERLSVSCMPISPGGVPGDRKFKPYYTDSPADKPSCECSKKAGARKRELLIVDQHFEGKDAPGLFSENVVMKGVDVYKMATGTILQICPTMSSKPKMQPLPSEKGNHTAEFCQKLAHLKRGCVHVQLHSKRDCAGTDEEKRGERGIFASTLDPYGGVICVGDTVKQVTMKEMLAPQMAMPALRSWK
jgi:hypothetical protein